MYLRTFEKRSFEELGSDKLFAVCLEPRDQDYRTFSKQSSRRVSPADRSDFTPVS